MADTVAPQEAQILYLEPDDEITSVVRRLREADAERVVLVAPGRTKATTSAIGLRLLQREAKESGREIALVADPAARALAAEAGIAAFASVAEAQSGMPADPATSSLAPPRASIHVVRGERLATPAIAGPPDGRDVATAGAGSTPVAWDRRMDDTQAIPVVAPPAVRRAPRAAIRRPRVRTRTAVAAGGATLLVLAAVVAAVLPAATVRLTPVVTAIGPLSYTVTVSGNRDSGTLNSTMPGAATGTYDDSTPAKGTVTFANYNSRSAQIPKGTRVSSADQAFMTDAAITVPRSRKFGDGTTASVGVTAVSAGPDGNVGPDGIDTVDDPAVRAELCSFIVGCPRLVANRDALTGGTTKTGPQITQKDVDAVVTRITTDLQNQLTSRMVSNQDRLYAAPPQAQDPVISIPPGLVGTKDEDSFNLSGKLAYDRRYVTQDELTQAGRDAITADTASHPTGTTVIASSVAVEPRQLAATSDEVRAEITVRAAVTRTIDLERLKGSIEGKSRADAVRALASVGAARIDFWPGWVDAVPRLGFRIDMAIDVPDASASPTPSNAP